MPPTAPPRRGRFLSRLFSLAIFFALIFGLGAAYQSYLVAEETKKFPAPGQLVDIGGRKLHLVCIGQGAPVVLFESSGFGSAVSASDARTAIARRTRVCSYDRRGMGWSEAGPAEPVTFTQLADDLHQLVTHAELPPPYVMVASSIGGLTTEMYARKHPDRVAGLIFLDAANSIALDRLEPKIAQYWPQIACLAKPAAQVGLLRLLDPLGLRKQNDAQAISRIYRAEAMQLLCGLVRGAKQSVEEFSIAPALPRDVRLTVLIAGAPRPTLPLGIRLVDPLEVREAQKTFAGKSTKGSWRLIERADHLIASSQPDVVAAAVAEMLPSAPVARNR